MTLLPPINATTASGKRVQILDLQRASPAQAQALLQTQYRPDYLGAARQRQATHRAAARAGYLSAARNLAAAGQNITTSLAGVGRAITGPAYLQPRTIQQPLSVQKVSQLYEGAEQRASAVAKKYIPEVRPEAVEAAKLLSPSYAGRKAADYIRSRAGIPDTTPGYVKTALDLAQLRTTLPVDMAADTVRSFREAPIKTTAIEAGSYALSCPALKAGGKVASTLARTKAGQAVLKEAGSLSTRAAQKAESVVRPTVLEAKYGAREAAQKASAKVESAVTSRVESFRWSRWTQAQRAEIDRWAGTDPARQKAALQLKADLNRWVSDLRAPENVAARTAQLQRTLTDLKQQRWWNNLPARKQQQVAREWNELRAYRNKRANIQAIKKKAASTRKNLSDAESRLKSVQDYKRSRSGSLSTEEGELIRTNESSLKRDIARLKTHLSKQETELNLAKMTPEGKRRYLEKLEKTAPKKPSTTVAGIQKDISTLQAEIKDLTADLKRIEAYHKSRFGSLSPEEWSMIRKNTAALKDQIARRAARLDRLKKDLKAAKTPAKAKAEDAPQKREDPKQKQRKEAADIKKNISTLQAEIKDLTADLKRIEAYHKSRFGNLSPEEWSMIRKNTASLKDKIARRTARLDRLKGDLKTAKMNPEAREALRKKTSAQRAEAEKKAKIASLKDRLSQAEAELDRHQTFMIYQDPATVKAYRRTIADLKNQIKNAEMTPEARKRLAQTQRQKKDAARKKKTDRALSTQIKAVKAEITRRRNPGKEIIGKDDLEAHFARTYQIKDITGTGGTRGSVQPRLAGKTRSGSRRLKGDRPSQRPGLRPGAKARVMLPGRKKPLLLTVKNLEYTSKGAIDLSKLRPEDISVEGIRYDPEFSRWLAQNLKRLGSQKGSRGGISFGSDSVIESRSSTGTVLLQRVRPAPPTIDLRPVIDLRQLEAEAELVKPMTRTALLGKTRSKALLSGKTKIRQKPRSRKAPRLKQNIRTIVVPEVIVVPAEAGEPVPITAQTQRKMVSGLEASRSRSRSRVIARAGIAHARGQATAQTPQAALRQKQPLQLKSRAKVKLALHTAAKTKPKTKTKLKEEDEAKKLKARSRRRTGKKKHVEKAPYASVTDLMGFICGFSAPAKVKKPAGKPKRKATRGRARAR